MTEREPRVPDYSGAATGACGSMRRKIIRPIARDYWRAWQAPIAFRNRINLGYNNRLLSLEFCRQRYSLAGLQGLRLHGIGIDNVVFRSRINNNAARCGIIKGNTMAANDETKPIFPVLAGVYNSLSPFSYAIMRFATGAILVPHGITKILNVPIPKFAPNIAAKGLPLPELLAYLTYFAESVAAACLAIGLFTRIAAAVVGIEMLVIVFLFQWQFGYFWTNRGYEFALLWVLLCFAIFFKGGGRCSVDRLLGREF